MSDDLKARIREIEESAKKIDQLAGRLTLATMERKIAKEAWEAAMERHMELCRFWEDSPEVEERPLIKAVEAKADESWRDEPIEVLQAMGLDGQIVDTLIAGNITTLGNLTNAIDHGILQSIPGVTGYIALQVTDALDCYWDDRAQDVQDADDDEDELDEMEDEAERSGLDMVTSRPGSTPETNGVEAPRKAGRSRKAKA